MAEMRNYFFRQKVTEAELDAGFDGLEDADKIFAVDFSQTGVIGSAMTVTEFATPNLTLDVSAGPGYSKTGERINVTPAQNVDVSQDENGSSTSVSAGNERWVQIEARFDRILSDPRIDGNGATVNFIRAEGFELAVVMGAEATTGNGVKPPVPSQHLLLVDFLMTPSKTTVVNADLVFTRRDDFIFTSADNIGLNPAGWTRILNSPADVQAGFNEVDDALDNIIATTVTSDSVISDSVEIDGASSGTLFLTSTDSLQQIQQLQPGIPDGAAANDWEYTIDLWQSPSPDDDFLYIPLMVPHGVTLESLDIRWEQNTDTAQDLSVRLFKEDFVGATTEIGSILTISVFGSPQTDVFGGALSEVIDRSTYQYRLRFRSCDASGVLCRIEGIRANYDILDLGKAAAGGS